MILGADYRTRLVSIALSATLLVQSGWVLCGCAEEVSLCRHCVAQHLHAEGRCNATALAAPHGDDHQCIKSRQDVYRGEQRRGDHLAPDGSDLACCPADPVVGMHVSAVVGTWGPPTIFTGTTTCARLQVFRL